MATRRITHATGALLVALPLVAGAAEGAERPGFDKADANDDGQIRDRKSVV